MLSVNLDLDKLGCPVVPVSTVTNPEDLLMVQKMCKLKTIKVSVLVSVSVCVNTPFRRKVFLNGSVLFQQKFSDDPGINKN